ncbi:unnamed protein product, partial [marine sediment metagenome]
VLVNPRTTLFIISTYNKKIGRPCTFYTINDDK